MGIVLLLVLVVGSVTLFIVGLVVPRRSRAVQSWIDRKFFKGRRESGKAPGRLLPKALRKSLKDSRKVLGKSAQAGRKSREKLPL